MNNLSTNTNNISIEEQDDLIQPSINLNPIIINYPKQKNIKYHIDLNSIPKITFFYCYQNNVFHHLELNFFDNWNYYGNDNNYNYQYIHKILSKYIKPIKTQYALLIDKKDIHTFCNIINIQNNDLQKQSNIKFMNEYKLLETNIFFKKYKNNMVISFQSVNNSLNTKQIIINNWDDFNHIITHLDKIKTNNHFLFNIDIILDYAILFYYS